MITICLLRFFKWQPYALTSLLVFGAVACAWLLFNANERNVLVLGGFGTMFYLSLTIFQLHLIRRQNWKTFCRWLETEISGLPHSVFTVGKRTILEVEKMSCRTCGESRHTSVFSATWMGWTCRKCSKYNQTFDKGETDCH